MAGNDINLIKRNAATQNQYALLEANLRKAAWWGLSIVFVAGVLVGATMLVVSTQLSRAEARHSQLISQINAQSIKEGILVSLKQRVGVAEKALEAAKPWGKLFPVLGQIAPNGGFDALSVEESGRVTADMSLNTIDDAVSIMSNILLLFEQKTIRTPELVSFSFIEEGTIRMAVSFYPVF